METINFADTYCRLSDDEIIRLNTAIDSLADEAREPLRLETSKRGITEATITATQEQWKQDDETERLEVQKPKARWYMVLAQIGIIFGLGLVFAFVLIFILPDSISYEAQGGIVGKFIGDASLANLLISMVAFRGKIKPTIIFGLIANVVITLFFLYLRFVR